MIKKGIEEQSFEIRILKNGICFIEQAIKHFNMASKNDSHDNERKEMKI